MSQLQAVRLAHAEPDALIGKKFRGNHACLSREGENAVALAQKPRCKSGEAAGPVAAHLGLAAIGVVVAHAKGFRRTLDRYQAVASYAAMAIAEASDLSTIEAAGSVTVINHDKVIPGTVHLGELQIHHTIIMPKAAG
jgi:hypothetical protein